MLNLPLRRGGRGGFEGGVWGGLRLINPSRLLTYSWPTFRDSRKPTQRARILKIINLAWTLENFKFSLEIFNLAWKLQSRLKISILILRIPPPPPQKQGFGGWLAWNFQSRLKMSFESVSLENFNPGERSWIFQDLSDGHRTRPPLGKGRRRTSKKLCAFLELLFLPCFTVFSGQENF